MKDTQLYRSPKQDRRVQVLDYVHQTERFLRPISTPAIEHWISMAYNDVARACGSAGGREAELLMKARVACCRARSLAKHSSEY